MLLAGAEDPADGRKRGGISLSELGDRGRPAGEPKKAVERMKWEETLEERTEERMEERGAEREKTAGRLRFLINLVYFGVLIVLTALAVRYLLLWMMPFVFAFLTAALLQRPLKWLARTTRVSKKVYSVMLVVLLVLLLAAAVGFAGSRLVIGAAGFLSDEGNIRLIENTVRSVSAAIQELINRVSLSLPEEAVTAVGRLVRSVADGLLKQVPGLFGAAARWLTSNLPALLVSFFIWIVASIFLSIDYDKVTAFFQRQIPRRHQNLARDIRELCHTTLFRMLRAYLLLMLLTFAGLSIGFLLLRIPYALPLAALISLMDILPVLGVGTALIPWALAELVLGDFHLFIGLGLLYVVVSLVRNILEPRVVSHQIGLHPLVTLFFMFLGLRATGSLAGMLLFPLVVMIVKQLQDAGKIHLWK